MLQNSFQAPNFYIRPYPPIQHEDGLETSILGLEFEVTSHTFPKQVSSSSSSRSSGGDLTLSLKCSSSVSTVNTEAQTTETHHQKSSVHFSYGSLVTRSSMYCTIHLNLSCPSPSLKFLTRFGFDDYGVNLASAVRRVLPRRFDIVVMCLAGPLRVDRP